LLKDSEAAARSVQDWEEAICASNALFQLQDDALELFKLYNLGVAEEMEKLA